MTEEAQSGPRIVLAFQNYTPLFDAEKFGGGGHPRVSTISFEPGDLQRAKLRAAWRPRCAHNKTHFAEPYLIPAVRQNSLSHVKFQTVTLDG